MKFSKTEAERILKLSRRRTRRKTEQLDIAPHLVKHELEYFSLLQLAREKGFDPQDVEDIVIRRLYKRRLGKRFGMVFGVVLILYFVVCLPNSVRLYKKLDPLREEFIVTALSGYDSLWVVHTSEGPRVLLDYGGRLDGILEKRDRVLKENCGILIGSWMAMMGTYSEVVALVNAPVFCFNPFHKVESN